jgi:hypothetical protein
MREVNDEEYGAKVLMGNLPRRLASGCLAASVWRLVAGFRSVWAGGRGPIEQVGGSVYVAFNLQPDRLKSTVDWTNSEVFHHPIGQFHAG